MRIGIIAIAVSTTLLRCGAAHDSSAQPHPSAEADVRPKLEQIVQIAKQRTEKAEAHCAGLTKEQRSHDIECLYLACPTVPDAELKSVVAGLGPIGTDACVIEATFPAPGRRSGRTITASGTTETWSWGGSDPLTMQFVNGKVAAVHYPAGER